MRCQTCQKEIPFHKNACPYCGNLLFGGKYGRTDLTWLVKPKNLGLING